ncbi:MFS transporter [Marinobacter qingdaonensis]|uniref:MFS transporter n=1 Tax=Marinobacter qingdaonensis TaxID=3108486 RepID=A0ABU5NYM3_9GAMM|nr:MFS transporter [Marinobacter sp. ASW11-75]MEA1080914.1 MFS transporter [Marinobacter sp. ASW11-75]
MSRRILSVVLISHFTAALIALGMPPFFGVILADAFAVSAPAWVGWFYIIPTVCTALSAPFWGRVADRHGRRWSLLRAQLGLAGAFVLAGLAPNVMWFALALALQGFLGGTFAASSAYLSTLAQGQTLAQALNWMQGSARSAMLLAPVLFGVLMTQVPAQDLYLLLAFLPLLSVLLIWQFAPADASDAAARSNETQENRGSPTGEWQRLALLHFGFNFSLVASFPYFIPWTQALTDSSTAMAGLLYSLPHGVYLAVLLTPYRSFQASRRASMLPVGLAVFAVSYLIQAVADTITTLMLGRLAMGVGMTLCLFAINRETARLASAAGAGRHFGTLDGIGKWAGVAAGLLAGVTAGLGDLAAPLWLGAATATLTLLISTLRPREEAVAHHHCLEKE